MKSFFAVLFFGALIALAGAFCEMWRLPYLEKLPTYRTLGQERSGVYESRVQQDSPGDFKAPFANKPNANSNRRNSEMRKAQEQLGR